ncbi:MAG: nitrous oxide reductase accessory protein NosL [Epsilonproteobacteria bacterium]|nr:nitrous oxide reductase accessory protein NosL [Campylobacterota bacterium]
MLFKLFCSLLVVTNLFAYPNYAHAVKEKKIYPMGKKIFTMKCSSVNVSQYDSYDALLAGISKTKECTQLKSSYKEALALYLWDVKRIQKETTKYPNIVVTHDEKCLVCGMFVYKYPRWVSVIEYNDGKKLYFDGVKDLMKYYFKHNKGIKYMLVQGYCTQETIALQDAYFVIGSDVYGPMGNELVAFKDKKRAENFLLDHNGKKVLPFDAITPQVVDKLDE